MGRIDGGDIVLPGPYAQRQLNWPAPHLTLFALMTELQLGLRAMIVM